MRFCVEKGNRFLSELDLRTLGSGVPAGTSSHFPAPSVRAKYSGFCGFASGLDGCRNYASDITETTAAKLELLGQTLLDHPPAVLVPLDGRPGPGETRHRGRLASRRLPSLLALAIPATRRTTEDHRGDSRSDPTIGTREPGLGCPEDPR
jgi:hypothetical protein